MLLEWLCRRMFTIRKQFCMLQLLCYRVFAGYISALGGVLIVDGVSGVHMTIFNVMKLGIFRSGQVASETLNPKP